MTHLNTTAWNVRLECDEDGFELVVETDEGDFIFNVHGLQEELIAIGKELAAWRDEGRAAAASYAATRVTEDDLDGYALDDPKRIAIQQQLDRQ